MQEIVLDQFQPREYQLPICDAIENKDYKRVLAIMPRRCLSGDTQILMEDGSCTPLRDLSIGDRILSHNGTSFVPDTVKHVWKTGVKPTLLMISKKFPRLSTGLEHKFAVENSNEVRWTSAQQLMSSDLLLQYAGYNHGTVHDHALASNLAFTFDAEARTYSSRVRLPQLVWNFDEDTVLKYFSGVISEHGNLHCSDQRLEIKIRCYHSGTLAWDVYWLLRKLGMIPRPPEKLLTTWHIICSRQADVIRLLKYPILGKHQYKQDEYLAFIAREPLKNWGLHKIEKAHDCYLTKVDTTLIQPQELWDIETETHHNFVAGGFLCHNSGKDITAFNLAIRQCLRRPCVVYYIFPTYAQARKVIWDSITNSGKRFLDFIPPDLISSLNSSEMKIRFINDSILQLIGSDKYDGIVGTNPQACVFSEYALQDPRAYQFIRPILTANGGWALFISTPRGKSHLWDLYQVAKESKEWFCYKLTLDDTKHIPYSEIQKERDEGIMSEDLIQQEYFTSFELGVEGAYYTKYIDKMRLNNQIGPVPWEPSFPVHTAWDLGVRDSTCIIFFQTIGTTVRIIDYYEKNKEGLEHYVSYINSKPYTYGRHIAPHDIAVKEFGSGMTRIEKAKRLGVKFITAQNIAVVDGIEAVRSALPKIYIDEAKCSGLVNALENYRQEYDYKRKVYGNQPLHNWASHACFTGDTLILTRNGMRQIMDIRQGDEVLTLVGWKKCLYSGMTRRDAQLVEVVFKDGTIVRCTPDHLFLTDKSWESASSLVKGTKIQSYSMCLHNTSMGIYTDFIRERNILLKVDHTCIEMFGMMLLEKYRKIATYITGTIIQKTTLYSILFAHLRKYICICRARIASSAINLVMPLPHGTGQRKVGCGIVDMQSDVQVGKNGFVNQEIVCIAKKNSVASSKKMVGHKNSATQIVKHLIIESVRKLSKNEDTYDIEVEDVHHFCLSNGAVVHNCDACRYMCVSLPKTRDGLTPEELDARYKSAIYGDQGNLPSFFRDDGNRY